MVPFISHSGLNKQWGENVGGGGQTVSLPISFEVAFTAVVSADSSWCNASCHITTTTITTMNYQSNKPDIAQLGPVQWLAIGIQPQWGTNTIGSRTTRTEAYPLPYSEFCLPIVSGKGYVGGLNYGFGVGVTNFGLTSVTIANNSEDSSYRWTGYTYIVVGAQPQWGKYTNSGNDRVITYPIAFSELYYANVISPDNCETFVYGISNTNINYRLCNGYNDDRWNGTQTSRLFAVGR